MIGISIRTSRSERVLKCCSVEQQAVEGHPLNTLQDASYSGGAKESAGCTQWHSILSQSAQVDYIYTSSSARQADSIGKKCNERKRRPAKVARVKVCNRTRLSVNVNNGKEILGGSKEMHNVRNSK